MLKMKMIVRKRRSILKRKKNSQMEGKRTIQMMTTMRKPERTEKTTARKRSMTRT